MSSIFFIILVLSLTFTVTVSTSSPSLLPSDLKVLIDLRRSLQPLPTSTFFSSWLFTTTNPCLSFSGVTCIRSSDDDDILRIQTLRLGTGLQNSPGLSGQLPPSISNLTSLTDLVVFPGRITGPLPSTLPSSLRLLSISNNLISGPIPSNLFQSLTNLHTLDLGHNQLTGTIPSSLFHLPELRVLVLASNKFSGGLPYSLSNNIFHLDLQHNSLTGTLPRQFPSKLSYLSVSDNSFSGPISSVSFSPNLIYIDLSMNAFTGSVPILLFGLPELTTVLLDRNKLSGELVFNNFIFYSRSLFWEVVDLSHNAITGMIPGELAAAQELFVNSNRFVGEVPEEIVGNVSEGRMSTFYAQHNFLSGVGVGEERWGPQLPEAVSVCLAYNCMEVPEVVEGGCPISAGTQEARPRDQCPRN